MDELSKIVDKSVISVLDPSKLKKVEEPTHPDDVLAHVTLANEIAPTKLALGEHVPNRVIFKNYLQSGCMHFNQVDAVRVGGMRARCRCVCGRTNDIGMHEWVVEL